MDELIARAQQLGGGGGGLDGGSSGPMHAIGSDTPRHDTLCMNPAPARGPRGGAHGGAAQGIPHRG
eukprot:scaffold109103_cov38-Prasinocladus_malaysianus.AAC.3